MVNTPAFPTNLLHTSRDVAPGIIAAAVVTAIAFLLGEVQDVLFGWVVLEPLVLALIMGLVIRAAWSPPETLRPGIAFSAKQVLEFAIVLLGASLDLADLAEAGPRILGAVLVSVTLTIVAGVAIGRMTGLDTKLAILVAVGNAICGNSAIAAVAPAIRAKKQDIAAAIALTAVLGVGVVLSLPALIPLFDLSDERYGVVAGLTVYAVPQVLAATLPVSAEAGQFGSLVKLTRVLLLGPVVALFAFLYRHGDTEDETRAGKLSISKLLPWFVVGFLAMALLRTTSILPPAWGDWLKDASKILTAVAMAGLGLSVDIRSVRATGPRVAMVVLLLTGLLVVAALVLVTTLGIG
jgi:uncharacterized integral membrane protein (TIGR00698 family)